MARIVRLQQTDLAFGFFLRNLAEDILGEMMLEFAEGSHAVVNPIIMGLIFFVAVTPTALIMRARGKDLLRLKREPQADSYWIVRQPPGPAPETLKDQF